jgi:hypothetical protein
MILDYEMLKINGGQIAQARRDLEKEGKVERMTLFLHSGKSEELKHLHHLFDGIIPKPIKMAAAAKALNVPLPD